jgi:hypothetical protein
MAKMFYTMDETKAALGKNEEEIKQFAREGRLREFRDGPRLMFKADQVETLKAELGGGGAGGDQVELAGPGGESGAPIGLVDSRGSSGSAIALADSSTGNVPIASKDDTALAADLSGSMGGVPSPGRGGSTMGGKAATSTGVTVFGADEVDRADPGAQTAISQSISDNASLESVGSGSGLLDLTRESDDTSLGALALDQTGPGTPSPKAGRRAAGPGETSAATLAGGEEPVVVRAPAGGQPVYREAVDEMAPAFAGAAAAACIAMLVGAYVLMAAVSGYKPAFVVSLASQGPLLLAAYGLGLAVVLFIVGLFVGKAVSR